MGHQFSVLLLRGGLVGRPRTLFGGGGEVSAEPLVLLGGALGGGALFFLATFRIRLVRVLVVALVVRRRSFGSGCYGDCYYGRFSGPLARPVGGFLFGVELVLHRVVRSAFIDSMLLDVNFNDSRKVFVSLSLLFYFLYWIAI